MLLMIHVTQHLNNYNNKMEWKELYCLDRMKCKKKLKNIKNATLIFENELKQFLFFFLNLRQPPVNFHQLLSSYEAGCLIR